MKTGAIGSRLVASGFTEVSVPRVSEAQPPALHSSPAALSPAIHALRSRFQGLVCGVRPSPLETVMLPEFPNQPPSCIAVLLDAPSFSGIEPHQLVLVEALAEHFQEQFLGFDFENRIALRNQRVKASNEGKIALPILFCGVGVLLLITTLAWKSLHESNSRS